MIVKADASHLVRELNCPIEELTVVGLKLFEGGHLSEVERYRSSTALISSWNCSMIGCTSSGSRRRTSWRQESMSTRWAKSSSCRSMQRRYRVATSGARTFG